MKNLFLLLALCLLGYSPIFSQIIVNKQPRTTGTTTPTQNTPTNDTNTNPYPTNQNQPQTSQYQNVQQLEHLQVGYNVAELGQTQSHNHYRISGQIYSKLNVPIFCHNRRIIMFQIDNWDSGFLNDNLQSIDGYATEYKLNNQGNLFVFGNSTVREFSFDFKVKKGLQPRVKSEIIKDWAPLSDYEQYLLLEYTMLNGTWSMEENTEAKFDVQFAAQGDQMMMRDIFGNPVLWTKSEGNTYIRKIGNVPTQTTTQTQQQPSTNSNSQSNYPSGGYLGNGNSTQNNSNSTPSTTSQNAPSNYPSGGYLGNGNSNNSPSTTTQTNTQTQTNEIGYSSVIEIVDRNTIRYRNSEGIVCILKKSAN